MERQIAGADHLIGSRFAIRFKTAYSVVEIWKAWEIIAATRFEPNQLGFTTRLRSCPDTLKNATPDS